MRKRSDLRQPSESAALPFALCVSLAKSLTTGFLISKTAGRDGCLTTRSGIAPIGYVCENFTAKSHVSRKGASRLQMLLFYEEGVLHRINEQLLSPNFVSLTTLLNDIEGRV